MSRGFQRGRGGAGGGFDRGRGMYTISNNFEALLTLQKKAEEQAEVVAVVAFRTGPSMLVRQTQSWVSNKVL
jgi:hypothetical protein